MTELGQGSAMKPLNVSVAEAIGWEHPTGMHDCCLSYLAEEYCCEWDGRVEHKDWHCIPRFDLDWSATGPLIEKFSIELHKALVSPDHPAWWVASIEEEAGPVFLGGLTPLVAVCNLVVWLKAMGRLPQ